MCLFQNGVIFHRGDQEDGGAQVCMHLHYSVDLLGAPSGGMWLHFFKWGSAPKRLLKGERASPRWLFLKSNPVAGCPG